MPFSTENSVYLAWNKNIIEDVFFYSSVVLVPVGVVLNGLQIKVFSAKDFKKCNFGFLMKAYVIFDTFALVWSFVIFQYMPLIGLDPSTISHFSCYTFYYVSRIIQEIPLFMQAFISLVNYLGVCYQSKFTCLKKKSNLFISFCLTVLFISFINIPNVFRELKMEKTLSDGNIFSSSNNKTCVSVGLFHIISSSETALLRSVLPVMFISILSVLNIKAITKSKRDLRLDLKREKRFAYVLTFLAFLYLIFNLPLACIQIIEIIYVDIVKTATPRTIITIEMVYDVCRAWAFVYYGVGFFGNILFNKIFRKNFCKLFRLKWEERNSDGRARNATERIQFIQAQ